MNSPIDILVLFFNLWLQTQVWAFGYIFALWAEIIVLGALLGSLNNIRVSPVAGFIGVSFGFQILVLVFYTGFKPVAIILISMRIWNRLMHSMNGNIVSRFIVFLVCFLILALPLAFFEVYMTYRHQGRQGPVTFRAMMGWLRWFLTGSRYSFIWGAIAIVISPVLFAVLFIAAVVNMLYLEWLMDKEFRNSIEKPIRITETRKMRFRSSVQVGGLDPVQAEVEASDLPQKNDEVEFKNELKFEKGPATVRSKRQGVYRLPEDEMGEET